MVANSLGMKVLATNRSGSTNVSNVELVSLENLLENSDIVSLHVSKEHGTKVIGRSHLEIMKKGAILINAAFPHAVDFDALHEKLVSKQLRAAYDAPPDGDFSDIPLGYFLASNAQVGFNTQEANQRTSDRATKSLINLLSTGDDDDLVNPDYKKYRSKKI